MITCPSCNHHNPTGALQCENCYTPLPAMMICPNCGASTQTDASFCGQCGFNLQAENTLLKKPIAENVFASPPNLSLPEVPLLEELSISEASAEILPETIMTSEIQSPWDDTNDDSEVEKTTAQTQQMSNIIINEDESASSFTEANSGAPETDIDEAEQESTTVEEVNMPWQAEAPELDSEVAEPIPEEIELAVDNEASNESAELLHPDLPTEMIENDVEEATSSSLSGVTQLQLQAASLLHLQSNTTIEIPFNLDVVHIGKPNAQIPPDVDVAGFPDSEVVSRIHADLRIEGDAYYIEDVGSSNGTYINHSPLLKGNRHRLRTGDRIALGKGDLVTFIFQLS
ncbi:MAG: FHA domain-containing protein [Cyanobacteria bacterium J06621_8]